MTPSVPKPGLSRAIFDTLIWLRWTAHLPIPFRLCWWIEERLTWVPEPPDPDA